MIYRLVAKDYCTVYVYYTKLSRLKFVKHYAAFKPQGLGLMGYGDQRWQVLALRNHWNVPVGGV